MHPALLRAVLIWLRGHPGWGETSCFLSRRRPCLSPPVQRQSPQELGSQSPDGQPKAMSYSSKPWPAQLSPPRPPAHPRASTRCLGLGSTYSVSRHTHPPGPQTESGETPELGEEAGEDPPSTRTVAGDGYSTRTRWVEVAQGRPATCSLRLLFLMHRCGKLPEEPLRRVF